MSSGIQRHVAQDPRERTFVDNPYEFYSRLHQLDGPVWWENYGLWCLSGFDAVNRALRDRRFARLPPPGCERPEAAPHLAAFALAERHSLLCLEPPSHTRLRGRVNRAFVSRQINSLTSEIETLAHHCIDRMQERGKAELLHDFATEIPVTIIARLLGMPDEDTSDLLAWSHSMVKVYTMTQSQEEELEANQAASDFMERLSFRIEEKRRSPANDLLSHLSAPANDTDPLTDEEIISVAILLLNAGHEATVHQIGNSVLTLLGHMEKPSTCFETVERGDATVNELLRFDPPLHLFTRYAQEDIDLGCGVILPRGESIGLLLGAANRDPGRFNRAEVFDPNRTDGAQLSLGAGLHFCIGAPLARLELRIALGVLFNRLPNLALADTPRYADSYHFHGLESLNVRF